MASIPPVKEQPQFGTGQFGAVSAYDGALGLRFAWGATFGHVLPNIDKALAQLNAGSTLPSGGLSAAGWDIFRSSNLKMLEGVGHVLTNNQQAKVEQLITEAWGFEGIGAMIERLAQDVVHVQEVARQRSLPRPIQKIVYPVERANLRPVIKRAAAAEKRARHAEARAEALEKRVAHLERKTLQPNDGIVVGLPPRVGVGDREREWIKKGMRTLAKGLTLAYIIAMLIKALEKIGGSWIRCPNVRRFGKRLCGMDSAALDALLLGSILIVSTLSIRELAREVLDVEDEIVNGVRKAVRELRDVVAVTEGGYTGVVDGKT